MKKLSTLLMAMFVAFSMMAQQTKPMISFTKEMHDFGTIKEDGGKVSYEFTFKNTGGQPLVVQNVQASCGCTTPEWTKMPVAPGGQGSVKVTFDPNGRPGNQNKTITVTSNAANPSVILRFICNVEKKEQSVKDIYPFEMGDIRVKSQSIAFTKIAPDQTKTEKLEIVSISDKPVKIGFQNVPAHITIKCEPETLEPGKTGVITATYDASKKKDWGFTADYITLIMNDDKNNQNNRLTLSATIEEDFTTLTEEQKANAPVIEIDNINFDFGDIKPGSKVEHSYIATNKGKSNLIIRKVKPGCGCTTATLKKETLAPGESTEIPIIYTAGGTGKISKSITVYTNDPAKPQLILMFSGNVLPAEPGTTAPAGH